MRKMKEIFQHFQSGNDYKSFHYTYCIKCMMCFQIVKIKERDKIYCNS